jgi:hypothetical protein
MTPKVTFNLPIHFVLPLRWYVKRAEDSPAIRETWPLVQAIRFSILRNGYTMSIKMLRYAIALTEKSPDLSSPSSPISSRACGHHTLVSRGQSSDGDALR